MKASDADRDAVLSELSEHFQAGRLTSAEFDERAGRALAARTWGELRDLLRDLPAARPGPASAPERPSRRPALLPVAVLAGVGIAVAVSAGAAHHIWGFWWILLAVLLIARRVTGHADTSMHSGPSA
jgi:hypothetical protein